MISEKFYAAKFSTQALLNQFPNPSIVQTAFVVRVQQILEIPKDFKIQIKWTLHQLFTEDYKAVT